MFHFFFVLLPCSTFRDRCSLRFRSVFVSVFVPSSFCLRSDKEDKWSKISQNNLNDEKNMTQIDACCKKNGNKIYFCGCVFTQFNFYS